MSKPLVIVESPTKAKTIGKFLGSGYEVLASYGHVRDLPQSATEIPASIKKEKWTRLGVNVENGFEPLYIVPDQKKKRVSELKEALKDASEVFLATDEDREGESISWHLMELLKPKVPVKRMVFHEITKEAIAEALSKPRAVDENLVRAQETRRVVDRLYGYLVSPILWKKVAPRLSAGRVQCVAIKLLVERERERISFRRATFWDLKAKFKKFGPQEIPFDAELTHVGDKRVASGKDFDPNSGKLLDKPDLVMLDEKSAISLREKLLNASTTVNSIEEKPYTQRPAPPFTTSTLQQEGNRKLGFPARRTMNVAQTLYENGFITYMRTDSTSLSDEAIGAARSLVRREFGDEFLPGEARIYKTQVKNAQEAHEAVRPAGAQFTPPDVVREKLGVEAFRLYELIWKRTVACQMKDARGTRVTVQIGCEDATFRATGKTIEFAGFLRAYVEGSDDPEGDLSEQERILPKLVQGEKLEAAALDAQSHETQPPPRFTEGSLIKELERRGIGRPSTWATIVDVVLSRTYAFKKGQALVPTHLGMAVTQLMEGHFSTLVDYAFTARLEDDLDAISRGEHDFLKYMNTFYNGNGHPGLKALVASGDEKIDPRVVCGLPIGTDSAGRKLEVRIGRWGPFVSDGERRAGLPDGIAPDEVTMEKAENLLAAAARGPESIGIDPQSGLPVYVKSGRFGPYIQLGDQKEGGEKPKMASLFTGMTPTTVTFEQALQVLSFPKVLGKNPENNEDIVATNGRYGPYIKCGTDTRTIPTDEISLLDITLEKAIEILKQPKRRGRGAATPKNIREIGKHPVSELMIALRNGRYGPYVTDGKVNASLLRGMNPYTLTVEEAVNLLEARAAKVAADEASGITPTRKGRGGAKKSPGAAKKGGRSKKKGSVAESEEPAPA